MNQFKKKFKYIDREDKDKRIEIEGQLPPQAVELEEAVLGALLLERDVTDKIMMELSPHIFYKEANRAVCTAIMSLYKNSGAIDILTVTQELKRTGELENIGGAYYVASLTNRVASSANIEFHVKILQQSSLKRSMLSICSQAIQKSFDDQTDVFDLYSETQIAIDDCLKDVLHYEVEKIGSIHQENIDESRRILESGGVAGIRSGLRAVDALTNGWQESDLVILAGRPSMGKTAAAVSMAIFPALVEGTPVAIFSCEMSKKQLVGRVESWLSAVNVSRIIKKQLTLEEIEQIENKCKDLTNAPIYIDDTPNISLVELKSKARRMVRENGVKLIVIDYLQLMRSGMNIGNREQEIAEISRGLKGLAKELEVPIIALSQLSRIVESRGDKKPMLSDLRESGQIEQDADMVIFCYRPEYYGIESYEVGSESFPAEGLFMFIIAKHRNGELGEIPLIFIHEQTKLTNYESRQDILNSEMTKPLSENKTFMEEKKENPVFTQKELGNDDIPF